MKLAYNTSHTSDTGITPYLIEKGWNPLLPVDHLKKNLLKIHPTAKYVQEMWNKFCYEEAICIAEEKEYNKPRYNKTYKEPHFMEGDHVLVSTLKSNDLKGSRRLRD
ncbi:hypothetical protein O181_054596 [Austropuccinia psidii MF-1]|uniref:Uncharacterized protein n=1 Tax=Austropuccinia psidii MF-1 TaxID=1389203 RepID=A0A9Q3E9R7_9BASI|nr:hypothetical protein [Austropuccinia psidii MF-1]